MTDNSENHCFDWQLWFEVAQSGVTRSSLGSARLQKEPSLGSMAGFLSTNFGGWGKLCTCLACKVQLPCTADYPVATAAGNENIGNVVSQPFLRWTDHFLFVKEATCHGNMGKHACCFTRECDSARVPVISALGTSETRWISKYNIHSPKLVLYRVQGQVCQGDCQRALQPCRWGYLQR